MKGRGSRDEFRDGLMSAGGGKMRENQEGVETLRVREPSLHYSTRSQWFLYLNERERWGKEKRKE